MEIPPLAKTTSFGQTVSMKNTKQVQRIVFTGDEGEMYEVLITTEIRQLTGRDAEREIIRELGLQK